MTTVTLTLGGQPFRVSCEAGEEARLERLAQMVSDKLGALPRPGDPRSLLYAALMLADDLDEAQAAVGGLEAVAGRLENLADRLEKDASGA